MPIHFFCAFFGSRAFEKTRACPTEGRKTSGRELSSPDRASLSLGRTLAVPRRDDVPGLVRCSGFFLEGERERKKIHSSPNPLHNPFPQHKANESTS